MNLMVPPYLIWNRYHGPPKYIWFPLPYMEHESYGPPTFTYGPPHVKCLHVLYDLWSPIPYMEYVSWSPTSTFGPPYLIWNMHHMVPPHVHMVPLHVKCLHVLYESYGPPYLIWNRYHMVPTCTYGPPHVKCLHVLCDSYGPPYLIWNG